MLNQVKREARHRRRLRIRKRVTGTAERPRLNVFRSDLHLYAQAIDDLAERTLCAVSTLSSALRAKSRMNWGNIEAAKVFGVYAAEELKKKRISHIVFDRGGYPFHGRIRAFAEALRENGIQF
ncbi:MAG: 50S ribosomal protein L18 [Omnitrophica bacterium RIFCSPLOWO2_12_FULL_50_11]|nr:MAG: 50S ribosomal protein L18 [Omnitrophica bacterium RIFCSPLOWO2_12_FULL_50_11]